MGKLPSGHRSHLGDVRTPVLHGESLRKKGVDGGAGLSGGEHQKVHGLREAHRGRHCGIAY